MGQSLSCIYIHLVFSTKNRKALIDQEIQRPLYQYMAGIARAYGSHVHEIGGVEDHVHILITLSKNIAICKLTEEIKKSSSKWIKKQGARYSSFSWQNGYGSFSIGKSGYDNLRKYIKNQENSLIEWFQFKILTLLLSSINRQKNDFPIQSAYGNYKTI